MKCRKKPVVIEAVQWDGNLDELQKLGGEQRILIGRNGELTIETLEGDMTAVKGDWIIKGVKGELYPCKPDIFGLTYETL